ncbi:early endosome antigen 1-like [Leucoraja erinacea]|uniref:early endosome antigen 1-like n=1 Tax=Leucoraja erinaceus TaxID=7782 RepID=UPI002455E4D0|nr:early endosome antigen 1-like [Leucoraja erinacea]
MKRELEQLKKRLKYSEDTCNEKERELASLKQALQATQESLKQRDKDALRTRRNLAAPANDVLRIQFINKVAQVKDLEKVRGNLEDQLKERSNELTKFQERENQMFEKQREMESLIKISEKENELKEREKDQLNQLLDKAEQKIAFLEAAQDNNMDTDDRLDAIRAELQALRESTKQQLLAKENELNAMLLHLQEKDNVLSMRTAELERMKDNYQNAEGQLRDKVKDLEECQRSTVQEDYSTSVKRNAAGIETLRLQLVTKIREAKDNKKNVENLEAQLRKKGHELESTKRSVAAMDKMLKDKDSEILLFQRNATMAEVQLNEREAELDRMKRTQRAVSTKVQKRDIGTEADGLRVELVDRLKEIRDLKNKVSRLENEAAGKSGTRDSSNILQIYVQF